MPKEGKFFKLFEESAQNAVDVAQKLKELLDVWDNIEESGCGDSRPGT